MCRGRRRRALLLRPGRLLRHRRLPRPVGRARASPSRSWPSRTRSAAPASTAGSSRPATTNLAERFDQGFRMLGLGLDGGLLLRSLHESLAAVGRDRQDPLRLPRRRSRHAAAAAPPARVDAARPPGGDDAGRLGRVDATSSPGVRLEMPRRRPQRRPRPDDGPRHLRPVGRAAVSHAHVRRVDHAARGPAGGRGGGPALRARSRSTTSSSRAASPHRPGNASDDRAGRLPHRPGQRRAHARRSSTTPSPSGRCRDDSTGVAGRRAGQPVPDRRRGPRRGRARRSSTSSTRRSCPASR